MHAFNLTLTLSVLLGASLWACGSGDDSLPEQTYEVARVDELDAPGYTQAREFLVSDDTRPLAVTLQVVHPKGVLEKTLKSGAGQLIEVEFLTGTSSTDRNVMWVRVIARVGLELDILGKIKTWNANGGIDRTFYVPVSQSDDELIARYAPTAAWNDPRFTPALGREHELMSLESGDSKIRITFEINEGSETAEP